MIRSDLFRSRSLVLTALSLFLGSFFILMGWLKISPYISPDIHRELRRNFIQFTKNLPFNWFSAKWYRLVWGYLELISGIVMVFLPFRRFKLVANILLLTLTILSIINHYRSGYKFDRIAPCIVFSLMLACRLIVEFQVQRRDRKLQEQQPPTTTGDRNRNRRRVNHNNNRLDDIDDDLNDDQFQDVNDRPKMD